MMIPMPEARPAASESPEWKTRFVAGEGNLCRFGQLAAANSLLKCAVERCRTPVGE